MADESSGQENGPPIRSPTSGKVFEELHSSKVCVPSGKGRPLSGSAKGHDSLEGAKEEVYVSRAPNDASEGGGQQGGHLCDHRYRRAAHRDRADQYLKNCLQSKQQS